MKRFLLLCLTALFALTTWAGQNDKPDFSVDGFYFLKLDDGSVAVMDSVYQKATSTYTGDLVIPASVEYEGTPYTVSSIFEYAFYNCTITSITLPETITSIGDVAFGRCNSLTDIGFLDGFTEVGYGLFEYCTGLEKITIPESIVAIGAEFFEGCENIKEVTIGSNVTSIGFFAFAYCTSLENFYSLNLEPPTCEVWDLLGLPWGVFDGSSINTCTLHVPVGSKEKYESADQWSEFGNIVEIDETITPPTVETLSVIDITNSTATLRGIVTAGSEEILEQGFQYWVDVNAPQTIVATSVSDEEISSTIQRLSSATEYTYRAYALTESGYTYGENKTFTTTNYDFAEENSEGATIYYKILSSSGANRTCEVQYLYYASTDNVVAYEGELTIPETVTHEGTTYRVVMINEYAFYECRNLTKVTIPESITDIGPHSFQNCTALEDATFPNTVSTMWEYTFDGCSSLKEAIIPSSVTSTREYVFRGCTSITELIIPCTVKTIETGVFQDCTGLKKVTLEEGITNTGYSYMFAGCTSLEDVSLPNTVTEFGTYTFYGCTSLKSFVYPNSMKDTGAGAFDRCTSLEDVTFSRNTTEISNFTFAYCAFNEMIIPEGVTTIGEELFMHNPNLTTVSLPRTVESIDYWLIYDCPSMEKLYSLNPTPPVRGAHPLFEPFEEISENCVLYVPAGSKEAYSTADMWEGFFKDIVEIDVLSAETTEATDITKNSATLNGVVTKGSFDVTGQGFEYWTDPIEATLVAIEGDDLTTTLSDLEPSTTYYYRAYATDTTGTTYGETLTFTTEDDFPDGIDSVGMSSTNSENIEGIYSTSGQKLNTTQKGVNIIRYTDGTTKKVIIK